MFAKASDKGKSTHAAHREDRRNRMSLPHTDGVEFVAELLERYQGRELFPGLLT